MPKTKIEFQRIDNPKPGLITSYLVPFHTKTLKKFLDIVRVSPEHYYKLIYKNQQLITNYLQVRDVLTHREHIPNKQEAKILRQRKAKQQK